MRTYILVLLQILLLSGTAYAGRIIDGMVRAVYDGD
nr:nuclease [Pseudomonadota bacterium]